MYRKESKMRSLDRLTEWMCGLLCHLHLSGKASSSREYLRQDLNDEKVKVT